MANTITDSTTNRAEHQTCQLCGGNDGSFNANGNHNLCQVRAAHGAPTPSLGERCTACDADWVNAPQVMSMSQWNIFEATKNCRVCKGNGSK